MTKIVITGFMGSGKTSVARALADLLHWKIVDLDHVIEAEQGRTIREIIENDGESRFRELEHHALKKILADPEKQVIALGGGAWVSEINRSLIRDHTATSVWLDAPFELCWKRIATTADDRPLARTQEAALRLFSERTSCYEFADLRVAVGEQKAAAEVAAEIRKALAEHPN